MKLITALTLLLAAALGTAAQVAEAPEKQLADAQALIHAGKYDEGIALLNKLGAQQSKVRGLDHELGVAYYRKGDFVAALAPLKRALEANPEDKEAVQLLGLSHYFTGKPSEAIPLLQRVSSWYATANVDASYVLGLCFIQTKDYVQARKAFAVMYGVPQDSAASYLFLARMLLRQGFDPIAEEQARKAIALDPKLPRAHLLLGQLYTYKSQIPEAIAEFEAELKVNPADGATYYKLADAYTRVMKFEDAEKLLQRSIWLDSTASGPFVLMAKVLLKKNETAMAVRTLQHALKMDPNNFMGHHLLGEAYRTLGQNDEAARELRIAQELQAAQNRSQQELQQ